MAARPDQNLATAYIVDRIVKASSSVTIGCPVTRDASTGHVLDATTGQPAYGVAMAAGAAGEHVSVCIFGGPVPVRVGTAGATLDLFAVVGTTGATDQTFGGGTTLKHGLGRFTQTGVTGDLVGIIVCPFEGVA